MFLREKVFAGEGRIKADTVLKNCRILNVNTKEITKGDIAISSGFIAGIGDVDELIGSKTEIHDIRKAYVCPGLIDGHVHFESSMVTLTQFAKQSILHGTTGIVIDPHEIANILGVKGIRLIMNEAKKLPIDVFLTIPSCVPSSSLETSGAKIDLLDTKKLLDKKFVVGLGEVMDYQEVLRGNPEILGKISAALDRKLVVDGHCPGMGDSSLFGYMSAGISSDHESVTYDEALEKVRLGMKLMLREGSAAKSLEEFIPRLLGDRISFENFFFVTDDKQPGDLIDEYMDASVRKAIRLGIEPIQAISMATINTARYYMVDRFVGSISIGRRANLVIIDNLQDFRIKNVVIRGIINPEIEVTGYPGYVFRTVKYRKIEPGDLKIKSKKRIVSAHVIEIVQGQLTTNNSIEELRAVEQAILPDIERDILSIAVIERHGKSGNISRGFIRGFGLQEGAIGQSIAHDSHNVVLIGTNFEDMALCANKIRELQGGIVIAKGSVTDFLHLPFAGILSTENAYEVDKKLKELHSIVKKMGCKLDTPFIQMSFLSLPVIPSIKITDKGLVDVNEFKIIPVLIPDLTGDALSFLPS
ncbi:MAG: adenine deaminase [Candidatus Methanoperedens sp.]|nr:adenine deaminase [Candidatus Methanoperedens sp.]